VKTIQAGLILRDFALTQLKYLQQFFNLSNNFPFNVVWHRLYAVIFNLK